MELTKTCGVYGIWFEKDLVYIGKTSKSFNTRFLQHKSGMKNSGTKLYCGMRYFKKQIGGNIICKPIKSFSLGSVSDNELEKIEMGYIKKYEPVLNVKRN